jgi:hypothetical protein
MVLDATLRHNKIWVSLLQQYPSKAVLVASESGLKYALQDVPKAIASCRHILEKLAASDSATNSLPRADVVAGVHVL